MTSEQNKYQVMYCHSSHHVNCNIRCSSPFKVPYYGGPGEFTENGFIDLLLMSIFTLVGISLAWPAGNMAQNYWPKAMVGSGLSCSCGFDHGSFAGGGGGGGD
jgi:hypothetical protein